MTAQKKSPESSQPEIRNKSSRISSSRKSQKPAALLLEDGSFWRGFALGAETTTLGECVFHTGQTGYQEVLSDPSYRKQILVFSNVQIGNQGFTEADAESARIWASGAVMRDYADPQFHWRKDRSLSEKLSEQNVPGIYGVDTRRLILNLREKGNLWGVLSTETVSQKDLQKILNKSRAAFSMEGLGLTEEVSTKNIYRWTEGSNHLSKSPVQSGKSLKRCVVMDFGVKRQILKYLIDSGFEEVVVVPAKTTASEIRELKPDALFLSNGPGDPAADLEIVEEVKDLIQDLPTFGICLGHQILGLALGLKTFKLKFGHHGANHPVKNMQTDRVEITSQNHGFAVSAEGCTTKDLEITHMNLNDHTVEGFRHKKLPILAIQFHPESAPGPMDSTAAFEAFNRGFSS